MPQINLKAGDFGTDRTVTIGEEEMYLPDPKVPGTFLTVPLSAITDVETVSDDHSGQVSEAVRLGLKGAAFLGPVGLAAGMFAMRKVEEVTFVVRLKDGRQFVATGDARIYANMRGARLTGNLSGDGADDRAAADVIAKYLNEQHEPGAIPESPARLPEPSPEEAPARPTFGRRRR
jgi:hypothetical protein